MSTSNSDINSLIDEGIARWLEVAGIDLESRVWHFGSGLSESANKFTVQLLNSRILDSTGLTTFMMLRSYFEWYLTQITFSASRVILEYTTVIEEVAPLESLRDFMQNPEIVQLINEFRDKTHQGVDHYGINRDDMNSWIDDGYSLAMIRRDALQSVETLDAFQFSQGDPHADSKAKYNRKIWEFWNINSLIRLASVQSLPGISLCLIRDPEDALNSFFVFALSNNETLTLLTDRQHWAHPGQKNMSRRPDRIMEERAAKHRLPYHLLELKEGIDARGQSYAYAKMRNQLVPINSGAIALADLDQLLPDELIWLMYMFELIQDKYFKTNLLLPELSYTGEMVREPESLVGAGSSLVSRGLYTPLVLPKLTKDDMTSESAQGQWEDKPEGYLQWMVDRYAEGVPETMFDVVGDVEIEERKKLLPPPAKEPTRWGGTTTVPVPYVRKLQQLDPLAFGPKEEIEQDRFWAARNNQMVYVQSQANQEYAETKDEIYKWFEEHVRENAEAVLDMAARGVFFSETPTTPTDGRFMGSFSNEKVLKQVNVLSQYTLPGLRPDRFEAAHTVVLAVRVEWKSGGWVRRPRMRLINCYERPDVRASIWSVISPQMPTDLAALCGVSEKDLPWQLQQYFTNRWEPYTGNSNLQRLDPIDWVLDNPWKLLDLHILIGQSKRAFKARQVAIGVPTVYPPAPAKHARY